MRNSPLEQFAESVMLFEPILPICSGVDPRDEVAAGRVPALSELAMHQSTIWQWNRAIFDPALGGHFRLELRALPSGPTPLDMTANSAFLLGATIGWANRMQSILPGMPFQYAEYNFYRAAQAGLDAQLLWPTRKPVSPRERPVTELILENLPIAQEGLDMIGVDSSESRRMLDIIRQRCERGINGARWQSARVRQLENHASRDEALLGMLREYQQLTQEGKPLHLWPVDQA
jgi:gamma-glutamyl:cysteine ligase YbdK (ATP-grasp superfamily)